MATSYNPIKILGYALVFVMPGCQCSHAQQQDQKQTTYAGNSPCGSYVRSFLNIPPSADCDRVKWALTLLHEVDTNKATAFSLDYTYGMQQQSGPGFTGGGTSRQIKGKCGMDKGAPFNPGAAIYRLQSGERPISFAEISPGILHLLYHDRNLMIGDAGWSYTLSKIKD